MGDTQNGACHVVRAVTRAGLKLVTGIKNLFTALQQVNHGGDSLPGDSLVDVTSNMASVIISPGAFSCYSGMFSASPPFHLSLVGS